MKYFDFEKSIKDLDKKINLIKDSNAEIFCIGDSFTSGVGVNSDDTWPSLLNNDVFNFGSSGLSHDGCLKNVQYILKNSNHVKQIICLLPDATRKLLEFEFLGHKGYIPISHQFQWTLPNEYQEAVENVKSFIFDKEAITNDWIKCCNEIINLCNKSNVRCWLSTWAVEMYDYIPQQNRLPLFPNIKKYTERANDGSHPHKKHYELFVKNIVNYIDDYKHWNSEWWDQKQKYSEYRKKVQDNEEQQKQKKVKT